MSLIEENLKTATNGQVVRIGDTVHRKVKSSPILHSYLQFLEMEGMNGVPRFLGIDQQGREILSYLPGKTQEHDNLIGHQCLNSEDTIIDMARFMRKLHDISEGFLQQAAEYGWAINPDYPQDKPETICHNDAASWNWTFVNDRLSGLFDFDTACPGTRMWDLTLPVFSVIPLIPIDYDHTKHAAERKRKVKLFFDSYGMKCTPNFLELLYLRMQDFCKNSDGFSLEWYRKVLVHIKENGQDWFDFT